MFQEKDYMNYRYFYKRAYFLAVLAASLKENKLGLNVKMEFGTLDGDNRRPILLLKPSGGRYHFIYLNDFNSVTKYSNIQMQNHLIRSLGYRFLKVELCD